MTNEFSRKVVELIKQGKRKEAEELLNEAIDIVPSTPEDFLKRGVGHAYLGNGEAALADYKKAVDLDPGNINARLHLGGMLMVHNQPEKALAEYEEIIRLDPENPHGHRCKINALVDLDRTPKAMAYLNNLLHVLPKYADTWNTDRATFLAMDEKYSSALTVLDEVNDPSTLILPTYSYFLSRAWVLCSLERYDEALDAISEGMRVTIEEDGCVPCFTNNCWKREHLEPLKNPPYRERLEQIIGPKPKLSRKNEDS